MPINMVLIFTQILHQWLYFHFFIYTYRHESSLYIRGEIIPSPEDTTQGDPLAMAMFALATIPLVNKLSRDVKQC